MKYDIFAMARTASVRGEIKFAPLPKDVQAEIDEWARKYAPKSIPIENTEEEMKLEASEKAAEGTLPLNLSQVRRGEKFVTRNGMIAEIRNNQCGQQIFEPKPISFMVKGDLHEYWVGRDGRRINVLNDSYDIIGPWTE